MFTRDGQQRVSRGSKEPNTTVSCIHKAKIMKEHNSLWEPRAINTIRYEVWPLSSDHLKLEEAAVSYENLYHINSIKRRSKTKQKRVSCELVIFSCNPWKNHCIFVTGSGVYSRVALICNFASVCGVWSRTEFNRVNSVTGLGGWAPIIWGDNKRWLHGKVRPWLEFIVLWSYVNSSCWAYSLEM